MVKKRLQNDQIVALKLGDKTKLETIRYILAQIKNREIDKKRDLNDDEASAVLRKVIKEIDESIEAYKKGGRLELVKEAQDEFTIVSSYLPPEISDPDLKSEIERIIAENLKLYKKNPKAIIGISIKKLKSKADPARILSIIQTIEQK